MKQHILRKPPQTATIVVLVLILSVATHGAAVQTALAKTSPGEKRPLNIAIFSKAITALRPARLRALDGVLPTATIAQVQTELAHGRLTSEELTLYYLWRIQKYDLDKLNAVTELNPDALDLARGFDAERRAGKVRGPLHGTVALLKDNIGTGDALHTTAGAAAMRNARADRDAFLVSRLREAGVIILGKTSMTEWANWTTTGPMPGGFSALGGQVHSPYGGKLDVAGSSSGSAVAIAANFATFAVGSETWGSLVAPAIANGALTIKPSMGLISRDRVIPILDSSDVAGPFAHNVADLALIMDVLVATDVNDPITAAAATAPKGFARDLNDSGLRGLRVGVIPALAAEEAPIQAQLIKSLKAAGAEVVELGAQPDTFTTYGEEFLAIGFYGFKTGVERYLAATNAPVRTITEVVAYNAQSPAERAKYGQDMLEKSANTPMTSAEFAQRAQAFNLRTRSDIDKLMAANRLDLIAGTQWAVIAGIPYPPAGYPAIVTPAGYLPNGTPASYTLTGRLFDDAKLIRAAHTLSLFAPSWQVPDLRKWR